MKKNNMILATGIFLGIASFSTLAMNKAPERLFFNQFVTSLRATTTKLSAVGFYLSEATINNLITVALSSGINPDKASVEVMNKQGHAAIVIREHFKQTFGWSQITYHDDGSYDIESVASELDGVRTGHQTATNMNYEEAQNLWRQDIE